jgi:UDP-GlcNAc3NAcA epimerase
MPIKLLTIIGARPQIIKAAALSRAIDMEFSKALQEVILHTGQHYDDNMSEVFFTEMGIPPPQYNLNVGSGSHGAQTATMIERIEATLLIEKPDYVILYGDTNSTLAGALAASKAHIPVVHVEAGLRSFNKTMPEEINRIVCDHCSTLLFSPTKTGFDNLVREGFNPNNKQPFTADKPGIYHCGDVMYDNSFHFSEIAASKSTILEKLGLHQGKYLLSTIHRNNNTDDNNRLAAIMEALMQIATESNIPVVLPAHPRTEKMLRNSENKALGLRVSEHEKLKIIPPVSFFDMIQLEKHASMVITDSGGVQKEAYFFGKPCLILRPETEWKEIVEVGAALVTDANTEKIIEGYRKFSIEAPKLFPPIFGDGRTARFICEQIIENFRAARERHNNRPANRLKRE